MTNTKQFIYGVQPVLEAVRAGRKVESIYLARGTGGTTQLIREEAQERRIAIVETSREDLTKRAGQANHQGVIASIDIADIETAVVGDILAVARMRNEEPLVVVLDQLQDPQNLGALIRTAYALGAHGVVITKDRAAQVTPAVIRASAGAALHVAIARVTNVKHAITELRDEGVWSAAAVLDGQPAHKSRLDGSLALVIGSEAKGVRPSVAEACDQQVSIPLAGGFDSLNASVAGGILLYEALRQRWIPRPKS